MNIKDRSAFPVLDSDYKCGMAVLTCVDPGISALEFIACNAPDQIPAWFVHTSPDLAVTPQPEWHTLPKPDQDNIKLWLQDGEDLPTHLKWYSEQFNRHIEEDKAFKLADMQARYFQWRRFYAEQLLAELSK
jgi:hypothetical protein